MNGRVRPGERAAQVLVVLAVAAGAWWLLRPASRGGAANAPKPVVSAARSVRTEAPRATLSAPAKTTAAPVADGGQSSDARVAFFSPWGGSSADQVGRERPEEGNPVGPMSLATDRRGRTYVLDQVNDRVTRRGPDGRVEATIPVKLAGAQDVAVADDGSMVVLDRLGDKRLAIYDEGGRVRGEIPLGGPDGGATGDPGLLTGVFVDGKDVWVEREHGTLIRVGDTSGAPAEPKEAPGRPSRDGALWLSAGIVDAKAGRAFVSAIDRGTGDHRFTRELRQKAELRAILLLDSDKAGTIYVGVEVQVAPDREAVVVTCLEPSHGQPVGSMVLPANTMPEETFRDLAVLDGGGVVYARRSEAGVTYEVHECE